MELQSVFAGFGGQGIVLMGTLLAEAGMKHGKEVTFYPSYGVAMRGGTANCSVIIADEPIASPIISRPNLLVVMNEPSLDVFLPRLRPGGTLLFNNALIHRQPARDDITSHAVPANTIAEQLGDGRMANMAMLGAVLRASGAVPMELMEAVLAEAFAAKGEAVVQGNRRALRDGYETLLPRKAIASASH